MSNLVKLFDGKVKGTKEVTFKAEGKKLKVFIEQSNGGMFERLELKGLKSYFEVDCENVFSRVKNFETYPGETYKIIVKSGGYEEGDITISGLWSE